MTLLKFLCYYGIMNPIHNQQGKFKQIYSKKQILVYLKRIASFINKSPTYRDLNKIPGPTASTVIRFFGSWSKALKSAGLRPHTHQLIRGEKTYIRENWRGFTDEQISKKLKVPIHTIRYYRLSSKLWKNTRNNKLVKATQKKLAMKKYGDNCEVCNMSIVELHHIISKSKNENHWSILCPLCHEIISRKIILIKNREDLFTKLKPFVKKLYSNLRL